ncbi:proteasome assembly chaperone family protein [Candidatus Woesearchaeota archaeon]|nr:proteasome assembly chaperone family protein [Candidatus Woesearchaeota archaeon]
MEVVLSERPKSPVVISGFPGVGMVGAIAAEFLVQHLNTRHIGRIFLDKSPALVAIHEGKLIEPLGIYYSSKYNVVVVHSIIAVPGTEWQAASALLEVCSKVKAKELISIEGVGSAAATAEPMKGAVSKVFYYTSASAKEKTLSKLGLEGLKEGIISGPTSAVLMKAGKLPVTCLFAQTHDALPDSNAAAQVIKSLDGYLGLKVDFKPLMQLAAKFEQKLRGIIEQSRQADAQSDRKQMSYVG